MRITEEEKKRIIKMWRDGQPIMAIVKTIKHGYPSVRNVLEKEGLYNKAPHSKYDDAELSSQVIKLDEQGVSRMEIGLELGITQPTIRKILREAGRPIKVLREPTRITEELKEEVVRLRNAGLSPQNIANNSGLSKRSVLNILGNNILAIRGRGNAVSPELFVEVWQASQSVAEVAAELDMTFQNVLARAEKYRSRGVRLKKYSPGRTIDYDALAQFADLFNDEPPEQ